MNRLVLAFGIVCLLQGLSAEPRPEFGLSIEIAGSSKLTAVSDQVGTIKGEIKGLLPIGTISSLLPSLLTTKEKVEAIINSFESKVNDITLAYTNLLSASNNDVDAAFGPFVDAIGATQTFVSVEGLAVADALSALTFTGISDQLKDAFSRINLGLGDLRTKTVSVKDAILAAVTAAGSDTVTEEGLRQFLTLKKMYDLLRSATTLRSYLPLVKYILLTVKENLAEADSFLMNLKDQLAGDVSSVAESFTSAIDAKTSAIKDEVANKFATDATRADEIFAAVSGLTGIVSATKFSDLQAAMLVLKNLFTTAELSAQTTALSQAFASITTQLASRITALQASASVTDNPLVISLVNNLVGNDEYGRYCYHKYKDLVENLFDLSFDAGWQCIDKEILRLEHLRVTLELIFELLAYDFDEVASQVTVCDKLTNADNLNACISSLSSFYTELFTATKAKVGVLFQLAIDEAVAVENRLLICFELVNLDTSITQVAEISADLEICSVQGPNGSD